jgi:hypothetical protein
VTSPARSHGPPQACQLQPLPWTLQTLPTWTPSSARMSFPLTVLTITTRTLPYTQVHHAPYRAIPSFLPSRLRSSSRMANSRSRVPSKRRTTRRLHAACHSRTSATASVTWQIALRLRLPDNAQKMACRRGGACRTRANTGTSASTSSNLRAVKRLQQI